MLQINFLLILQLLYLIYTQNSTHIFEQNKNLRFRGADLQKHEIMISSTISKNHQMNPSRRLTTISPIRIILDTTYLEEVGNQILSLKDKIPMIKEEMNKAVKALNDIIEVEQYGNYIFTYLNQTLFDKYRVYSTNPLFEDNTNIPADFIILTKFEEIENFRKEY